MATGRAGLLASPPDRASFSTLHRRMWQVDASPSAGTLARPSWSPVAVAPPFAELWALAGPSALPLERHFPARTATSIYEIDLPRCPSCRCRHSRRNTHLPSPSSAVLTRPRARWHGSRARGRPALDVAAGGMRPHCVRWPGARLLYGAFARGLGLNFEGGAVEIDAAGRPWVLAAMVTGFHEDFHPSGRRACVGSPITPIVEDAERALRRPGHRRHLASRGVRS